MRQRLSPLLLLFVLFAVSGLGSSLLGQEPESPLTVREVRVRYDGFPSVSEALIRGNIQVQRNTLFEQVVVDRSIRSLYQTGFFEFIAADVDEVGNDEVVVTFRVKPKYRIESITFRGNEKIKTSRLMDEIATESGDFFDEFTAKSDEDAIFALYLKKGFSNVDVDYEILRDDSTGRLDVIFSIIEGQKIRVNDIDFEGIGDLSASSLRRVMQLKEWNFFTSWLTGTGRFDPDLLVDDRQSLLAYIRDQGYLDVEIPESAIRISYPEENKVDIFISVDLGKQYSVGTVSVTGNTLFSDEEILDQTELKQGDVFSPSKVAEAREEIRLFYGADGYLETFVRALRSPNLETGAIDLNYQVSESGKFDVESINIQGNTKTKSIVIIRELALAPGDTFDLKRMRNSQLRLENTRYFESVSLRPESTNIPGRKDLSIVVQEGRTGNLTFGAGFSSLERAVFFAEISQGNFDIFNWRSYFQGDGQKFRLRFQIGSRSNEIVLSFEEPWLFEQRLALGFEIFRRETDFNSAVFNELRTGFEVYLRKRLFELVEGRLSYSLEQVNIFDVSEDASSQIQEEEGNTLVSKVGGTLTRDTRDRLLITRTGNRLEFNTQVAGGPFGGDVDYWKNQIRASQFIPTFEYLNQGMAFFGRIGTIVPYSDSDVPFFDRFFLGGPNTLRGFGFRDVGPKDENNEPIGGNSFAYFSAEYMFQLAQPLEFVLFYDWGFVNPDDWDFGASAYNDDWGFGFRVFILGAPLRLDFGFPITSDDTNDDGMQFNFSFGTRF
ncbi:MAG: outer membrane protein assembly factor BamA [Verrucomicrobiota bacterium]